MDNDEQEKFAADQAAMTEQLRVSVTKLATMLDAILPEGVEHTVLLHHTETRSVGMCSSIDRETLQKLMESAFARWAEGEAINIAPPPSEQH